jgi:NAD(P)-dependent dehydrogenase (short-subunit alcohol dehydrogenase family)
MWGATRSLSSHSYLCPFSSMQTIPGIALVTGGSSGIGRASAIALARAGWQCIVAGRRKSELDETVRLGALGEGEPMLAVEVDLSITDGVDELFAVVMEKYGE